MATPTIERRICHGVSVLTLQDQSFPLVRFVLGFRRGAFYDPPGQTGVTRTMLDLLLRGTQSRARHAFNAALEELGSSIDTTVGAELAIVSGVCLKRFLPQTMALLQEALLSPAFDDEELERLNDESCDALIADRDDDDAVADYFLRRHLYVGHPMARCPIGEVPELESLTRDHVLAAYGELRAGDLVVGFAGALTAQEAEAGVAPLLAGLPVAPSAAPFHGTLPDVPGLRVVVVDKPDRTQVQLRLARLALDGRHPDTEGFWLGVTAFGGTFTSPLTRAVRDERGWSYVAHADFRRRGFFRAPMVLRSAPALADAINCLALELELYRDLAQGKLDVNVLTAARDYLLNRYPFDVATVFDVLGSAVGSELLGLPADDIFGLPGRLEALDLASIPTLMQRHLHADNILALLVAPATEFVPELQARLPHAQVNVVDFREGLGLKLGA